MMAVMVMLYTTVLSTKIENADGWSGHGGGEAEGQWIISFVINTCLLSEAVLGPGWHPRVPKPRFWMLF